VRFAQFEARESLEVAAFLTKIRSKGHDVLGAYQMHSHPESHLVFYGSQRNESSKNPAPVEIMAVECRNYRLVAGKVTKLKRGGSEVVACYQQPHFPFDHLVYHSKGKGVRDD
jgi:hypothetical protein